MKAIALFSKGLDSTLAIKTMCLQGIEVIALHFLIPFDRCDSFAQQELIKKTKEQLGVELKIIQLGEEYLEIIKQPRFGFGKNLNPCIDCKILMLKRAKSLLTQLNASFVITGEVVGQRPKSQHRDTLCLIEKHSGLEGLLLRPLSAKLLPETEPEKKGWVKREALYAFNGRTRVPQIELAKALGIEEYAWPGGGCLLTVESFCTRIEDLMKHQALTLDNTELLHFGRHFRLAPEYKLVVGRNEQENNELVRLAKKEDIIFEPACEPGPTAIGRGIINEELKTISAQIVAFYTSDKGGEVEVKMSQPACSKDSYITLKGMDAAEVKKYQC